MRHAHPAGVCARAQRAIEFGEDAKARGELAQRADPRICAHNVFAIYVDAIARRSCVPAWVRQVLRGYMSR